jgi:hypothetical protein
MVAECSKADTGVGPAIAENNQGEKGSCADLAAAANNKPPPTMARSVVATRGMALNASERPPDEARAAPAARYRPRSPNRVVMKA